MLIEMGADAFIAFYGIEEILSLEEASVLDYRTDDRIARARRNRLSFHLGRVTDGRDYHLLIGKKIADLGVERREEASYVDSEFAVIQAEVKLRLKAAGFSGEPKLLFRLNAEY